MPCRTYLVKSNSGEKHDKKRTSSCYKIRLWGTIEGGWTRSELLSKVNFD